MFARKGNGVREFLPEKTERAKQGLRVRPSRAAEEPLCAARLPRAETGRCRGCWPAGCAPRVPLLGRRQQLGIRECEDRGVDI